MSIFNATAPSGGGSAKNVQINQTSNRSTQTSITSVLSNVNSITCSTTGTYDVYWSCARSSTSGTWSSQLFVGVTAISTENAVWDNHVQNNVQQNVQLSAGDVVSVHVKSRGSNYYGYAPQLTIVQS